MIYISQCVNHLVFLQHAIIFLLNLYQLATVVYSSLKDFSFVMQLEACAHPFFDELREPNALLPDGRPFPPLFNFKQEVSVAASSS